MSNSDNPFLSPTLVATEEAKKAAQPKRGVAHIVRRSTLPPTEEGESHVISRHAAAELSDDSIDQLITSPELQTPSKPVEEEQAPAPQPAEGAMGKAGGVNPASDYGTGTGDLTVEEGRLESPETLVSIAEGNKSEQAPQEDPSRGFLKVTSGSDLGRRVGLLEGRTIIGRGLDCDIVLTDPAVSRQHAYVERRENVYVVCDLDSGNGIHVNEREREGEVLIVHSDSFRIGNTVLTLQGPEAQDEAAAPSNWRPTSGAGKKKHHSRQQGSAEESTVAGKGRVNQPPEKLPVEDPPTQLPTNIVSSVEVASDVKRKKRNLTAPPPIPEVKNSVQAAALAAVSSIMATPPPEAAVNQTGLAQLPNQAVPPTPYPANPYPVNQPGSNPFPPANGPGHGHLPLGPQGQTPMSPQGQMPMNPGGTPPMMGGYGPATGGHMQQPSAAMMQRPMLAGAGPDMMRHYGQPQLAPRENGKLLIGFISVTLVLVVVGLVATIMGQVDDKEAVTATPGTLVAADAGDEATTAASADANPATGVAAKGATRDPDDAKPDDAKPDDAKPDDAKPDDAKPDDGPGGDDTAEKPLLVASLIANNTQLPVSTWGTDESFLRNLPKLKPIVEPIPPTADEGFEEKPEPKVEPKNPRTKRLPRNPRAKPRNPRPRNPRPRNDGDNEDGTRVANGDVSAAKSAAKAMYKRSDFDEAADRLGDTADRLNGSAAEKLLDIAAGYRQVGALLATAQKEQKSNPASALKAYKKALAKDKRIGGGAHSKLIRLRIGQVAPRAAKSYMVKGKFAEANIAADDARRYNEEDAVEAVYASLERKANSLIKKALKIKKKGDDDEAKRLLRDATEIAPKDTDAYDKSRAELRKF